jgi:crotonobetainyl-CoA:carnitine CoA-transferase CaiB-like acyl-CoA transferase
VRRSLLAIRVTPLNRDCVAHWRELVPVVDQLRKRTSVQCRYCALRRCLAVQSTIAKVFAEPQVRHRALRLTCRIRGGSVPVCATFVVFTRTPIAYERPPPGLGADTDDVLREYLGLRGDFGSRRASSRETRPVQGLRPSP